MAQAELLKEISRCAVSTGHLALWWLGGSGFACKTSDGTLFLIDPYLSDSVQAIFGQGRAFPPPLDPSQIQPQLVLITHWHEDHLDPGTIPVIAAHSPSTHFVMPPSAMSRALSWGVPRDRITPLASTQSTASAGISIEHVPARHESGIQGWETPDAMGMLIRVGDVTIYHTGDTEYDGRLKHLHDRKIGTLLVCINGTGGNMNAHEAALLAWQLGAKTVVPMHHYLWAGAEDAAMREPGSFAETYQRLGGAGTVIKPTIGGLIDCV